MKIFTKQISCPATDSPPFLFMNLLKTSIVLVVLAIPFLLTACHSYRNSIAQSIRSNNIHQVESILAQVEEKGDSLSEEEQSALLYEACKTNNLEMVRLICNELRPEVTLDSVSYGVLAPSKPVLEILFEYDKSRTQELAAPYFSWLRNEEMASFLLEKGCSPLPALPSTHHLDVFKLCVRSIGLKNISQKDLSMIIHGIISYNDEKRLQFLLEEGLDLDAPFDDKGSIRDFILSAPPSAYKCVFLLDKWKQRKK